MILVEKKNVSLRFSVDYRKLNPLMSPDAYRMPRVNEVLDPLRGSRYVTTLDSARGYCQVPMDENIKKLTAFITLSGLYQFKVMQFGLSETPATFQRLMD